MAEKEERILIARSMDYTLTDTDKGELFEGKIEPHCANVMTRQEAIERMAKALCAENLSHSCEDCMRNGTNDCFINEKEDFYKSLAEAALNALLREGK